MYKVCFNEEDKIIGFDLLNPIYYINLFDINNVTKEVTEYNYVQKKDSLGRKLYTMTTDGSKMESVMLDMPGCEFEPIMLPVPVKREVNLVYEPNLFTVEDIAKVKEKQLHEKYQCLDCLVFELMDETEQLKFNAISGRNIIRILKDNTAISDKITINAKEKINVYCESDQDIQIQISTDGKKFIDIEKDTFIPYTDSELYIKFICAEETNIYCVAILIS